MSFTVSNALPPLNHDGTVTAGTSVVEPVPLPTTATSIGSAVDLFDFKITDGGTDDTVPLKINQVVAHTSGTANSTTYGKVTWLLNGPDASNVTGTYNSGAGTITFSGLSISVANGGNETYVIRGYYNDNTSLTDNQTFVLSVNGSSDFTTMTGSTLMASSQSSVTNGTGTKVAVTATKLGFTTQPAGSTSRANLSTQPVVKATDAAGNLDTDFTGNVTLVVASGGGTLSGTTTVAASAGVVTYATIAYYATADQQAFTLSTSNAASLTNDTSNSVTSDVAATTLQFSTQPAPTSIQSGVATPFTTIPVVRAVDAGGVVDTAARNITLTVTNTSGGAAAGTVNALGGVSGDANGSATIVTIPASSGVATFTGLSVTYTNSAATDSIALNAASTGLTAANSSTITSTTTPAITSSLTASGTYGLAISTYTITATNSPTSYNATGLPSGLNVNTFNGQITGTPTTNGSFSVTISATNAGGTGNATLAFTIAKAALTITGVTGVDKTYDGTTTASLNVGSAALSGVVNSDSLSIDASGASATFADKNKGTAKTVTAVGFTVTGANAANYTLSQPSGLAANITAKALTITGLTANNKTYNATTAATLSGTATFLTAEAAGTGTTGDGTPYSGDDVSITGTATATFASKDTGTGVAVTVSGYTLTGAQAGNYSATQPTGLTANITAKALTASGLTASNKVYSATTAAAVSGTPVLASAEGAGTGTTSDGKPYTGDLVSITGTAGGSFSDANVGTAKTVTVSGLSLTGGQAADYTLTAPTTTANITAKALTVSGLSASNKIYNATTVASLTGTAALVSAETAGSGTSSDGQPFTGDDVSLSGTAAGTFASKDVGSAIAVTVSGVTLSGAQSTNYSVTQPSGLTADITVKTLTVSGLTAANRTYNATTTASISGTAALIVPEAAGSGSTSDGTPYTGDTVSVTGTPTGTFADANAGTGKTVTIASLSLTGTQAANYVLGTTTVTADISAKALTLSGVSASNKVYNGDTTASLSGTPTLAAAEAPGGGTTSDGKPYTGDDVSAGGTLSGSFADRHVGTGKVITITGATLSGAQASNYTATQPSSVTADITAKALTLSGVSASNKTYDATTTATLTGTAALASSEAVGAGSTLDGIPYTGDAVAVGGTAAGAFATKNVGSGIVVTVTGLTLSGAEAGDYTATQPTGVTASITAKALTISGLSATGRTYNATTAVALSGTPALLSAEAPGGSTSDGKPYTGDTVGVTGTASGAFADASAASNKAVTVSGLSLSGTEAGNYTAVQPAGLTATVTAKALTINGLTASNRTYDGTTSASLSGTPALLAAETAGGGTSTDGKPFTGDSVSVAGTAAGSFADRHVGTAKAITVSGLTLSGTEASNYTATPPTGVTADIAAKALTVSGLSVSNRIYDATTTATLTGTAALLATEAPGAGATSDGAPYTGDIVALGGTATGTFASKDVGAGIAVTVTGLTLSGAQASDYNVTQPTGLTANITAKALTITGLAASNKTYNATATANLTGSAALLSAEAAGGGTTSDGKPYTGDTVGASGAASGGFADANVGTGKSVTVTGVTLSGTQASNYTVTQPTGLTANITAKALTIAGITASNKVYDATTTAAITGTAVLSTAEAAGSGTSSDGIPYTGDAVTIGGTASATFASKDTGTAIAVTVTGYTLSGAQASNYTPTQPASLSADITAKTLTVSGLSAANKVYNATTAATVSGTAALQAAETAGTGATSDGKPYTGDAVTLGGTASGAFADANAATGKTVTVTGLTLSGSQAADYVVGSLAVTADITPKPLTISGLTAGAKIYDGTTTAAISGTAALGSAEAVGTGTTSDGLPYVGDAVNAAGTPTGSFADRHVGAGKPVTVSGVTLSGAQASNYSATQPTALTATITAKTLTSSGLSATNKIYNATTAAALSGTAALASAEATGTGTTSDGIPYTGDVVSISGTAVGTFAGKDVGAGIAVTVTGLTLSGSEAGDYTLTQPTGLSAAITTKALTVTGLSASNKVYNATTAATLSGSLTLLAAETAGSGTTSDGKPYTGDTVGASGAASGGFADANVGTGKSVTVTGVTLSGTQASNYTVTQPTGLTANITAKALTIAGVTASNKVYDATTTAAITGTAVLSTAEAAGSGTSSDGIPYTGDAVTIGGTASATFASKDTGTAIAVTVTGYTLSGAQASNYTPTQPASLTADITPKTLTVSGLSAANKVYNATTAATVSGTAALQATETAGTGATSDGKPYTGDAVTLGGTASGAFADANAATGKTVTVTGLTLSGSQAADYVVGSLAVTADITPKPLTVSGLTATNRVYDGTTTVSLGGTATLGSAETAGAGSTSDGLPYTGDAVNLSGTATGTFADRHVGASKPVTVTGLTLAGAQAGNYSATPPTGLTADITAKGLNVSGLAASNKVYDATTSATITGTAALATAEATGTGATTDGTPYTGDSVSIGGAAVGTFASKDVASGIAVSVSGLTLTGAQAGDYSLTAPTGLTATITPKPLTLTGLVAASRTYNATTVASLSGTMALLSAETAGAGSTSDGKPYTGDVVNAAGSATGAFSTASVGTGKTVTVTGLGLSGAQAGNYSAVQPTGLTANITAKALTISGVTATNKVYDATTNAALTGTATLPTGETAGSGTPSDGKPYTGDSVSINGTATATFATKDAGVGIGITVTGYTLTGTEAANYTPSQPAGLTADITAKVLTISGVTAADKTYDATTAVVLGGAAALPAAETAGTGSASDGKPYTGDVVTVGGTPSGAFSDANAGAGKTVTITGLTLGGAEAADYAIGALTATATISAKALTISGLSAGNKVYDGTTNAPLSGSPAIGAAEAIGTGTSTDGLPYAGDTVNAAGTATGAFANRHVGTAKAVTVTGVTLSGAQAANYTATPPTTLTADITAKGLTASGLSAASKTYDATNGGTLTGTAALLTAETAGTGTTSDGVPYSGDVVSIAGTPAATFASKDVGSSIAVAVTGLSLTGADATDYTLAPPAGLTASIAPKQVAIAGFVAGNKVYDGTTAAAVSGTGTLLTAEAPGSGTTLDGKPYTGDIVSAAGTATGVFADRNVGTGKTIVISGLGLTGAQAANYAAVQPVGVTANITVKALTIAGLALAPHVYDGTTTAAFTGTASLATAEAAGTGTVSDGRPYVGDTVLASGTASGVYATRHVGTGIAVTVTGLTLSGASATNYVATQPAGLTGTITAKPLTVVGVTANSKTYDGTSAATLTGTAALQAAEAAGAGATSDGKPYTGDGVVLTGTAVGAFADANVGSNKTVSISGLALSGTEATDYALTAPTAVASINPAGASIVLSNLNQTYDGAPKPVSVSVTPSVSVSVTYNGLSTAPTNAGSYSVLATVLSSNYSGATTGTLVIAPASQTITFPTASGATVTLNATASSGLPVTYAIVSGTGTISGTTLTITAAPVVVRATQAGDANHLPATANQTFSGSTLLAQTITFAPIGDQSIGHPPLHLTATASSGLPVSFSVVSGPARLIQGDTLVLTGPGTVSVRASQSGNATFAPAPDVTQTFTTFAPRFYFGDVHGGGTIKTGDIAAYLPAGSTEGTLLLVVPGLGLNLVVHFHLESDGTFTVTVDSSATSAAPAQRSATTFALQAPAATSIVVRGTVTDGQVTGQVDGQNVQFSANILPSEGSTAAISGYYESSALATNSGTTAAIVGPQGQVLVVANTAKVAAGGEGTVATNGSFVVQSGVATITAAIDPATTSIAGTIATPSAPTVSFSGLNADTPKVDRLSNLSSRARASTGASVLITGFVIAGTEPRQILVRAIGPGLKAFGVSGILPNPRIRLYNQSGGIVAENDNWGTASTSTDLASTMTKVGAFALVDGSADAALVATLPPGAYSAQVSDDTGTGVALAEIYDVTGGATGQIQRLVNLSTRADVGTGDNALIGGFVVTGNTPKRVLVRAIGPGLTALGVTGALSNPRVDIYQHGQWIAGNDDWGSDAAAIAAGNQQTGAFALTAGSKDAAVIVTLAPDSYTAIVTGADGSTGIALVEVYEMPASP